MDAIQARQEDCQKDAEPEIAGKRTLRFVTEQNLEIMSRSKLKLSRLEPSQRKTLIAKTMTSHSITVRTYPRVDRARVAFLLYLNLDLDLVLFF
jgi:hypothetical protein